MKTIEIGTLVHSKTSKSNGQVLFTFTDEGRDFYLVKWLGTHRASYEVLDVRTYGVGVMPGWLVWEVDG